MNTLEEQKQEETKKVDSIVVANPKDVMKTYSVAALIANIFVSVSSVGFAALGALTYLDMTSIFILMSIMSTLGLIGRFIQQDINTEKQGALGFKGLAVRFYGYIKGFLKGKLNSLLAKLGKGQDK